MAYNAIYMALKNNVFLIAPVQFSVVRIVILFNIQFSNTVQNTPYFVMYMFFSSDFTGFRKILLIAQSCAIFGSNSRRPDEKRGDKLVKKVSVTSG